MLAKADVDGHLGAGAALYQRVEQPGQITFARLGLHFGDEFGDGQPEHPVAQKLKPLIVVDPRPARAGVGEGLA
jgi:hypothetical protein